MTAYLQYSCNICSSPIIGMGAITLVLTQTHGKNDGSHHITTDTKGLSNPDPKEGQMVSHICSKCAGIIATNHNKKEKDS